ncbi:hypothetical protein K353_04439 [Kitasatospora sp. SolWspMP-SS2h]|uniref:DNA-binding protein n=1 Tax=Kitasatospora sp. SolWspMP-SS2h TaxID=1305729 RepID=UPI000DB9CCEE|nr:DNA-binding protein [Kitasatospora sp. SolWspMP-SS2h]RAJ37525.1 hypothetical protein K353_04439 [Kitasatospora sp. SolWspMP-SS2h]
MSVRIGTVVLDSRGMSAWISQDRELLAMIKAFHSTGAGLVAGVNTLVEISRAGANPARPNRVLSQVRTEPVTEHAARASAELLGPAGLHGHKYAIDATVAETALRRPGPVALLTSDVDDMAKLCGSRIRLIAI